MEARRVNRRLYSHLGKTDCSLHEKGSKMWSDWRPLFKAESMEFAGWLDAGSELKRSTKDDS